MAVRTRGDSRVNQSPKELAGDLERNYSVFEVWPQRRPSEAPPHTPPAVARKFVQGEDAFKRGDWDAAVAMYRSALDVATKGMEGVPSSLFKARLKWLYDQHRITEQMHDWGSAVRIEGNVAMHDEDEFTKADAEPLRLFTEMFLRYIFELPGEVVKYRGERPGEGDGGRRP